MLRDGLQHIERHQSTMPYRNAVIRADAPAASACADTVPKLLNRAARSGEGFTFHAARGEVEAYLSYAELRERALEVARGLVQAGLASGARLALMAETNADFMVLFFACQYAGIVPVPLPLPLSLGGREAYEERLKRQIMSSGAQAAVASSTLLPFLREAVSGLDVPLVGTPADFYDLPAGQADPRPFGAGDACYIQYSSGSTRFPKGVIVSQRSLISNAQGITRHGLCTRPGDRCVSWLPLYHDMGLVGFCLAPLQAEISVHYLATQDFARRPLLWLDLIATTGGTISFSPTFGYDLCVRRAERQSAAVAKLDLSCWRVAGIGGDMIQPNVLQRFAETFAMSGFRAEAFVPSYGLAESTLAVTFAPLGQGVQVDVVDKQQVSLAHRALPVKPNGHAVATQSFVVCGRPLPDHAIEIRDEDSGRPLPDRRIGKVYVRGGSVMDGYFGDAEATARILSADGWLDTGDMGYTIDGSVVVTGRSKDLIICNGRNIWPQDIEWAIEQLPGLRRGDAAAFAGVNAEGAEIVVAVVECRLTDPEARAELRRDVTAVIKRSAGVECEVVLVRPHSLPHTSSGKLSRSQTKAKYDAGLFAAPENERSGPTAGSLASVAAVR